MALGTSKRLLTRLPLFICSYCPSRPLKNVYATRYQRSQDQHKVIWAHRQSGIYKPPKSQVLSLKEVNYDSLALSRVLHESYRITNLGQLWFLCKQKLSCNLGLNLAWFIPGHQGVTSSGLQILPQKTRR